MTWLSILSYVFSYLVLPVTFLFNVLVAILSPVKHLGRYIVHAIIFLPLRVLGKFETLYIYFGVAALIGVIAGSILHFSSSLLVSILDLRPNLEEPGRTAASVRAAREKKKLEQAWPIVTPLRVDQRKARVNNELKREYPDFVGKDRGTRSLLSQTILEEDDDSDDPF